MGRLKERLCQRRCHGTGTETRAWDGAEAGVGDQVRTRVDNQVRAGVGDRAEAEVGGRAGAGAGSEAKPRAKIMFQTSAEGEAGSGVRAQTSARVRAGVETPPDVCVRIGVRYGNGLARFRHWYVPLLAGLHGGIGSLASRGSSI